MQRIEKAAWALVLAKIVHALIPADTEADGYVGDDAGTAAPARS